MNLGYTVRYLASTYLLLTLFAYLRSSMPVTYGRSRTARYGNFPHLGASGCHLYRRSLIPCSPALALISARAEGVSTLIPLCCMPCMLTMSPVVALLCSLQVIGVCLPSPLQIQTSSGYEPCALTCVVIDHFLHAPLSSSTTHSVNSKSLQVTLQPAYPYSS